MTVTLTEFLLARIAEDEDIADIALSSDDGVRDSAAYLGPNCVNHMAQWSPARVLAECEAKRQIIERYRDMHYHAPAIPNSPYPELRREVRCACRTCVTEQILALPYADHPDYDEAWRP